MPIETEVKIKLHDLSGFRDRLKMLGAVLLSPSHFEDNHVLDFPDGRLRSRKCLMRVRITDGSAWLTFKGPPLPGEVFKKREEWETSVGDGYALLQILAGSGMMTWFRYQKRREEHVLRSAGENKVLHIVLDETPIGDYAEIEGEENDILLAASRLGIVPEQFIRESYYYLYDQYCRERGISSGNMVFAEREPKDTR